MSLLFKQEGQKEGENGFMSCGIPQIHPLSKGDNYLLSHYSLWVLFIF